MTVHDTTDRDQDTVSGDRPVGNEMARRVGALRGWLPPVDPAAFDCFLGELATELDPFTEADPVGVLVTLLSAAGVHVGSGPHVAVGFERHPLLTWPLVVGNTGTGRKGTGFGVAKALLSHACPDFVAENVQSGLSSGEGLAAVFADSDGDTTPKRGRLLPAGDVRLLAYEPEWASVMARMKREGNTLSATLRAAWEGGNLSTLNVDARVARRSHIGIVAHITPQEFAAKVQASDLAGGTYNRFLPVAVAQSKFQPVPKPVDPTLLLQLGADLSDRLAAASRLDALTLDHDAQALWHRLYVDFTEIADGGGDQVLAQFTSRALPNCLRIAATHAALDRTPHITRGHLTAAAALVRYSVASARAVLRPTDVLARLLAFITEGGPDGRTRDQIRTHHFQGHKTAKDVTQLLDQLTASGAVVATKRPPAGGRGRAAEVYVATTLRG